MQLKTKSKTKPKTISSSKGDDLILKRKGGGSIIDHRPLFSSNGEIVYIICKQVIRAYSAQTGDFIKELEPAENKIIDIVLSPENSDIIIACTENGELVYWNCHNGLITKTTKLLIDKHLDFKIKTFHIIYYKTYAGNDTCGAIISSIIKAGDEKILRLEVFDLKLGNKCLSKNIERFSEDYSIHIVGNHGENLIAIGHSSFLYIINPMHGLKFLRHKTGRSITCVSGHPEEECLAVGDDSGRIVVWKNLSQYNVIKATYHWHTLPVTEIIFSKSGGHMYSGGGECVLVKWLLSNPQNKCFLPRLPAPIRYITIAPENIFVAVSTLDNGILIVNPQRKITTVIQNFTWGVAGTSKNLFTAGLIVDPRTNSIVLNSRTGHIQFYNTHTKGLLYNVDITSQNFITNRRSTIIVNTDVTRIAINSDGSWMATMEERDDNASHIEIRLKFWQFNVEKQNFALNTSVELPHEIGVHTIKFRPKISSSADEEILVTVGKDDKFKLWCLADSSSIYKKAKHWMCYSVGNYRNLSPLDAGFSSDGSLIGVSFDCTLTLWVPETSELKSSLSHSRYLQPITRIEFGKQECCHLVVTASTEHLAVWDILSLTVKWSVPLNLATLTSDSLSTYMAVFTTDNTLFIFTPENSEPVYSRKNVVEKDVAVLGTCFVPNIEDNEENTVEWQKKSQFVFINSEQEILTLESKSESNITLENLATNYNLPLTSFNRIVAEKQILQTNKQTTVIHDYARVMSKGMVNELLNIPAHTLPPMRMVCLPFILSLFGKSRSETNGTHHKSERNTTSIEEDGSDDSAEEPKMKVMPVNNHKEKSKEINQKTNEEVIVNFDWEFLNNILPSNSLSANTT